MVPLKAPGIGFGEHDDDRLPEDCDGDPPARPSLQIALFYTPKVATNSPHFPIMNWV